MASLKNYSGLLFITDCFLVMKISLGVSFVHCTYFSFLFSHHRYCKDLKVGLRFGLLLVARMDLALLVLVGFSSSGRQSKNSALSGSVPCKNCFLIKSIFNNF